MNIRYKLILNYSIISVFLLVGFSLTVLLFSVNHRNNDFNIRLQSRAKSAVKMLIDIPQIDSTLLKIIDDNTLSTINNFSVIICDSTGKTIYSFSDIKKSDLFDIPKKTNILFPEFGQKTITFNHIYLGKEYLVKASATDIYGLQEINYLVNLILFLLLVTFVFIIFTGFYNAYWSLKPFRKLISEIESFNINKKRLNISGTDEVAQLSHSFNNILDQLIKAYDDQKSFVSHVSHELRTPITALIGNVEITLKKDRTAEEYREIVQSTYEDGIKIAQIINGFLELAEANLAPENVAMSDVRVDELLFSLTGDFLKSYPDSKISVDFLQTPSEDSQLTCYGNSRLLRIMFRNLIENAIKYSESKEVEININFTQHLLLIEIIDWGIGIAPEEINNIYTPLFRGHNVSPDTGHGLGLSIAQKIAELHKATIQIESELNIGSKVHVKLPSIN